MSELPGRLGTLQARDIMTPTPVVLPDRMEVGEAVGKLRERRHSGAPVVDDNGFLVGTLSVRDIIQTKRDDVFDDPVSDGSGMWAAVDEPGGLATDSDETTVGSIMRKHPPAVSENARLIDVVRCMCENHMHRVPVINATGKLTGIISTMDVLAALVHIADESC